MLLDSKGLDARLKVIDFGTSKKFTSGTKMTQKFGTVNWIFFVSKLLIPYFRLIILLQKSWIKIMMKSVMFGLAELSCISCYADILLLVVLMIEKSYKKLNLVAINSMVIIIYSFEIFWPFIYRGGLGQDLWRCQNFD